MLIIRGVNVFPSQIEYAVMGFPELATQYQIIIDRPDALDVFTVKVELTGKSAQDKALEMNSFKTKIQARICSVTGLNPIIDIVKPGELPRTEGKAKRVLDLRSGKI